MSQAGKKKQQVKAGTLAVSKQHGTSTKQLKTYHVIQKPIAPYIYLMVISTVQSSSVY